MDQSHTSYVSAGMCEAFDNARGHEIAAVETDDRNLGVRIACNNARTHSVSSEHADLEVHQLRHKLRQPIILPVAPPVLNCDVANSSKRSCLLCPREQTCAVQLRMSLRAKSEPRLHSIISSARARNEGDRLSPSAFAVLTLITNMNFDDTPTGRSLGLVPFRI